MRPNLDAKPIFSRGRSSLQIQSVVHRDLSFAFERIAASTAVAIEYAQRSGVLGEVEQHFSIDLTYAGADEIARAAHRDPVSYRVVVSRSTPAGCHNRLASACHADIILIVDPSALLQPQALYWLLLTLQKPGASVASAKLLPVEQRRFFDPSTGATSWATQCCMMVTRSTWQDIGGFDETFFGRALSDVDLSWRVRARGGAVILQPRAVVHVDENLAVGSSGWPDSHDVAEAVLLLAYKWSLPHFLKAKIESFSRSENLDVRRAVATFAFKRDRGLLPTPQTRGERHAHFMEEEFENYRT